MLIGNKNTTKIEDYIELTTNEFKLSLSICSYNVNGLFNKLHYPYFFEFLCNKDVFFCLETHIIQQNKITQLNKYFPNYNLHWKLAERMADRGRGIGGLLIGWKCSLVTVHNFEFEIIEEDHITTLLIKKDSEVIMPIYLRKDNWRAEFCSLRSNILNNDSANLIVMGDANIRIGEQQQESIPHLHNNPKISHIRRSQDKVFNAPGRNFIEMCDDFNLRILNGAFYGDELGSFTFSSFKVENAVWSDHLPICIEIKSNGSLQETQTVELLPKMVWIPNKRHEYCTKITQHLSQPHTESRNLMDISQIIINSAPTLNYRKRIIKKPWFDKECEKARLKSFKKLNEWRHAIQTDERQIKKVEYIQFKKLYTQILNFKERTYWEDLKYKLNTVRDSKEWWRLSRQYTGHDFNTCTSINIDVFKIHFEKLLGTTISSSI